MALAEVTHEHRVVFSQWENVWRAVIFRSVSRSPSPSPRPHHNDSISDTSDLVKDFFDGNLIDGMLQGVDALAQDPGRDDCVVLRGEGVKPAASTSSLAPRPEGPKAKKKSWYNSLYPTYKSKCDDFKRLFKDLPDDERLIVDYSCALQKDILAHGRLYASQNYLCFYASIFGWETSLTLRWKDVTAITKEKTALVIPNAILVCTESEKNFLTSFAGRDKVYLMLFRFWQNALMDQQMSSNEMWQWVHSCYGEELGFNSDEECPRDLVDDALCGSPPTAEELETSSLEAGEPDERRAHRQSAPPVLNGDGSFREEGGDTLPTDMSDSTDSEPDKTRVESETCNSAHEGKLLCSQQFPFNVDNMFTMIFTSSKFNLELLAARGITDYVQAAWQPQGGLKCRQISYTLGLTSGPLGPKEVNVTETQVMNKCSKPGVLYSIDSSGENAGIPYADYFTVEVHYCLRRVSDSSTHFTVYGHVRYKKTMWPMVKTFLEKNALSGLEEYCKQLESKLVAEAAAGAPARKQRRNYRGQTSSSEAPSLLINTSLAPPLAPPAASGSPSPRLLVALVLLLLLNALLYYRLYYATPPVQPLDIRELQDRLVSARGPQSAEWASLLEQHAAAQRAQLQRWRRAVDAAVTHLAQTEQALAKLLETIKPSLERAQKEATDHRTEL